MDNGSLNFSFILKDKAGRRYYPNIHIKLSDAEYSYSEIGQQHSSSSHELNTDNSDIEFENSFHIHYKRHVTKGLLIFMVILFVLLIFSHVLFKCYSEKLQNNQKINVEDFIIVMSIVLTFPDLRNYLLPSNLKFAYIFDYFSILIWFCALFIGLMTMKSNSLIDKIIKLIDRSKLN